MDMLESILSEGKEVRPVMELEGKSAYTFEDYNKKRKRDAVLEKYNGENVDLEPRKLRPDGTGFTASRVRTVAVNPELQYSNRYRKTKFNNKQVYEVVLDYRAIKEQQTGEIYTPLVKSYLVAANENEELEIIKVRTVQAEIFINVFTSKFNISSAKKIYNLVKSQQQKGIEELEGDDLDFK